RRRRGVRRRQRGARGPRGADRGMCACGSSRATAARFPPSRSAPSASRSARRCSTTAAARCTPPARSCSTAGRARSACNCAFSTLPSTIRWRGCDLPGRVFYGWYGVGAFGLVLTPTSGLGFYNLSVLLDAFVRERGFPVARASGATACYFVGSGVGGVVAGWLIERVDPRVIVSVSAVLMALLLACLGILYSPIQLYLFHLVYGLCYGCGGIIPNITTVARWFEARRSLAISIASTGLSLGGIAITPTSAYLIEHHGIAGAAPWLALAMLIGVVPATALVV